MGQSGKRIFYILLVFAALVAVFFVVLISLSFCGYNGQTNQIYLEVDGSATKNLDVSLNGFHPGDSKNYTIVIGAKVDGTYNISVDFQSKNLGGLEQYINVTFEVDGESVLDSSLSACLEEGKTTQFEREISKNNPVKVVVTYNMPLDVGNDAQLTTADFSLVVKVEQC